MGRSGNDLPVTEAFMEWLSRRRYAERISIRKIIPDQTKSSWKKKIDAGQPCFVRQETLARICELAGIDPKSTGLSDDTCEKLRKILGSKSPKGVRHVTSLKGHGSDINRLRWSPDGQKLASGSDDRSLRIWSISEKEALLTLLGHNSDVNCMDWSPDGQFIVSGAGGTVNDNNFVIVWDAFTGEIVQRLDGHRNKVFSVTWSPNGETIATGSFDEQIFLWDTHNWQKIPLISQDMHFLRNKSVRNVAWSPDGKILASSHDNLLVIWEVCGSELRAAPRPVWSADEHNSFIASLEWCPISNNGRNDLILATGSEDKSVRIWHAESGYSKQLGSSENRHTGRVNALSFSADARFLATKGKDEIVKIWIRRGPWSWELITSFTERAYTAFVSGLAFNPKSPVLASVDEAERLIQIWQLTDILFEAG